VTHNQSLVCALGKLDFSISLHCVEEVEITGAATRQLRNQFGVHAFGFGSSFVVVNDGFSLL